jgi:hypothetical protein
MLEPGDVRRSIEDAIALYERTTDQLSVEELLRPANKNIFH